MDFYDFPWQLFLCGPTICALFKYTKTKNYFIEGLFISRMLFPFFNEKFLMVCFCFGCFLVSSVSTNVAFETDNRNRSSLREKFREKNWLLPTSNIYFVSLKSCVNKFIKGYDVPTFVEQGRDTFSPDFSVRVIWLFCANNIARQKNWFRKGMAIYQSAEVKNLSST